MVFNLAVPHGRSRTSSWSGSSSLCVQETMITEQTDENLGAAFATWPYIFGPTIVFSLLDFWLASAIATVYFVLIYFYLQLVYPKTYSFIRVGLLVVFSCGFVVLVYFKDEVPLTGLLFIIWLGVATLTFYMIDELLGIDRSTRW